MHGRVDVWHRSGYQSGIMDVIAPAPETPELIHGMEGWRRYALVIGGMVVTGLLCTLAVPWIRSAQGTIGPTVLQAESVPAAVGATLAVFAAAVVVAGFIGRLVNAAVGMFVLGCGLWALRLRSATITELALAGGSLGLVVLETLLWGVLILGATFAVWKIAGPLRDIEPSADPAEPAWQRWGLPGVGAAVIVPVVVMIVARSPLAGQTLMAVVLGGMASGLAGRLISPHAQPYLLFAAPCVFGAVAAAFGLTTIHGSLPDAYVNQGIPAVNLPMPIDYAAGSLAGVAMGLGWAKGFLHHEP